ncbi:MAG: molybdenum ABC transporter ATP-binding protein [Gammaproteobacteria bacterium]|nr:molybdenum ABC transporter ATP-binding protein [Gammaproteobacteria bacterium]MBQ0840264.1 molybdenum ABC transporter ATP-binding protein [Gammaproteobacteria bacterium]
MSSGKPVDRASNNQSTAKPGIEARFQLKRKDFALDIDFAAPGKGVTALFGPSGSGKTTLLRCIAGLEKPTRGHFTINGQCWHDEHKSIPVHRRPMAYVFQEASLFPHLNVRENMAYGWRRMAKRQRKLQFDDVTAWLGLDALLDRRAEQLSGGQRQRVAIARALLTSPQLLLMDEPLASLDASGKAEILPYLESLWQELDIPVLYVSHAPEEVQQLADHLILLDQGRVVAAGELNALLTDPLLAISHFEEAAAVLEARVVSHDTEFHLTSLAFDGAQVSVSYNGLPLGHKARLRICARDVSLALVQPQKISISNSFSVRVVSIDPDRDPSQMLVRCEIGGQHLLSRITRRSVHLLNIEVGKNVYAQVKTVALMK